MPQFDVHENKGKHRSTIPYVVVVQSSYFDRARRRVVVPLVALDEVSKITTLPSSRINPEFVVAGTRVVLNPLEIVSVPVESLGERIDSLASNSDTIVAALDELFSQAWS